jgi:predicted RNase H-like HicB family nuclease
MPEGYREGVRPWPWLGWRVQLGVRRQTHVALPYAGAMDAREFDVVMVAEPEGGYSVFVPELPSVATQGETIEEARTNAQEAIEGYLEVMHEDDLPVPSVHRDRVAVHAA